MNVYLEIFGYLGTALIFLSMMMTSISKLRLFNILGSVISAIYALCTHTLPVFFLNAGLVIINIVQLIKYYRSNKKQKEGNLWN